MRELIEKLVHRGKDSRISSGRIFLLMLYHPLETYDIIKAVRDEKSRMLPAVLLLLVASIEKYVYNFVVSFQFRSRELNSVSLLVEMAYVILPLVVWVIANFCITAIMDGETKLREIFITACYCLAPYIIITPIQAILSHVLGAGEAGFYYFLQGAALVWVVLLLFVALLRQNNYSFVKALGVTIICVLFMILFVAIVVFLLALTMQFVTAVYEVLQEAERKLL